MIDLFQINNYSYYLFILGLAVSIYLFNVNKTKMALFVLTISGLYFRFIVASADPFLHVWDEQFHALVAQHMIDNPFRPVLIREPIFPYSINEWTGNHIWLHKQPWFLWQMAISIKFFGSNALSVRIPSLIMSCTLIIIIYRIGKLMLTKEIGFYSALIYASSNFFIDINSGFIATDHNDIAYLFYVSASVWSLFEYMNSKKTHWLILIGLFSGIAVLNKWLSGLIVFPVWGLIILLLKFFADEKLNLKPILISFLISVITFLPWQLFIHFKYPQEAAYEMQLNGKHFFEAVEGHGGDYWFHYESILKMYGKLSLLFILPGIYLVYKNLNKFHRFFYLAFLVSVFTFYTLAATKMTLFIVILTPFVMIAFGAILNQAVIYCSKLKSSIKLITYTTIFVVSIIININKNLIVERHVCLQEYSLEDKLKRNFQTIQKTKEIVGFDEKTIYLNCKNFNNIPVMFFTNNIAYAFIPDEITINKFINLGYKPVVFNSPDIPNYIKQNPKIKTLAYELINLYND